VDGEIFGDDGLAVQGAALEGAAVEGAVRDSRSRCVEPAHRRPTQIQLRHRTARAGN